MLHSVFIVLHAAAGLLSLTFGVLALRRPVWFDRYLGALVAMAVFLAAAVARSWPDLDAGTRAVFAGLGVLAAVMLARAVAARALVRSGPPHRAYVGHVGFTLISLFDGFVVVAVLDLGGPGWLAAAAAVTGVLVGHLALGPDRRRALASSRARGGSGLGLSIVAVVVAAHGGTVSGASGDGCGLTVRLPLAGSAADSPPSTQKTRSASDPSA